MDLPLTGERTVPDVPHENYWFRRHEVAYQAAAATITGMAADRGTLVLDAGAGEGYGAALISESAQVAVTALDYDSTAVGHARQRYGLNAVIGNLVAMPFPEETFDVVVSLQTIEHVWDQPAFIAECARVLRSAGKLIVTTPNRLTFPPGNAFHTQELSADELAGLLAAAPLRIEHSLGVHHGPRLAPHHNVITDQITTEPRNWPETLTALVSSISTDDFVFSAADIDHSLDLYLAAVRT